MVFAFISHPAEMMKLNWQIHLYCWICQRASSILYCNLFGACFLALI